MDQVVSNWDAHLYTEKHAFVYEYGKSLIGLLDPKKGERILDLGCGSGQLTYEISELGAEVIGMDRSAEMLESAEQNFPTVHFERGDAAGFHFEEKFDAIFSNATLHWVTEHEKAIKCMYNNLKSGGRIVLEFGGKGNVKQIVEGLRKSLMARGYAEQSHLELWYFPSVSEYTSALESVGFEVVFAQLYDRPTVLADTETGITDWLGMFGSPFLKGIPENEASGIRKEVQDHLGPKLFKNGKWHADYRRIRIVAYKL